MEAEKVDKFLLANESKFPEYEIPIHRLLELSPEKEEVLSNTYFVSPVKILIASFFLGSIGLDRFLIRDWIQGACKLLTMGGFGFWYIIDLFLIMNRTKRKNMERLEEIVKKDI